MPRYDFLATEYAARIADFLRKDGENGSDAELFRRFAEKTDPTAKEKDKPFRYLKWACIRYLETPVLPEDLYKISEDLTLFEDRKKRGLLKDGKADIQHYSIKKLADFTTELRGGTLDGFDDMLAKAPAAVTKETTILYRGPEGIALVPHSRESGVHWSRGTRWCTGAENGQNAFFSYNIRGPLVILFTAAEKARYQGHVYSAIMDAQDRPAAATLKLTALLDQIGKRFLKQEEEKQDTSRPSYAGPEDPGNRDYVLAEMWEYPETLYHSAPELRRDRDFLLDAVEIHEEALKYAAPELRTDRTFIFKAVKRNPKVLQYVADEFRADREIISEAVRKNGYMLEYAAPELKADRKIVREAVLQSGRSLCYAAQELQADRELVIDAIQQNGWALQYAAPELRKERKLAIQAVRQCGLALQCLSPDFQNDEMLVLDAVRQNGWALKHAAPKLQTNREFILKVLQRNGKVFQHVVPSLRDDPDFQREALRASPEVMDMLSCNECSGFGPLLKRESFMNGIRAKWTNIAYAADCGVTLSPDMQREIFSHARRENPEKLVKTLHLFPALRDEWKKRALSLDEASVILGRAPAAAPGTPSAAP